MDLTADLKSILLVLEDWIGCLDSVFRVGRKLVSAPVTKGAESFSLRNCCQALNVPLLELDRDALMLRAIFA